MFDSSDSATQILNWNALESRRNEHIFKFVKKCITNTVKALI